MIRFGNYFNVPILLTFLAILLFSTRFANNSVQSSSLDGELTTQPTISATSPSVPLMFIENVGQFDEGARFQVSGGTSTMWLAEDALWITMFEPENVREAGQPRGIAPTFGEFGTRGIAPTEEPANPQPRRAVNLKLSFVGANPHPEIEPFDRLETYFNFFRGNDAEKWRSHVPAWGGVRYKEIYPGIDLELTSENGQAVQRLVARSGANLDAVSLRVDGADEIELLTASSPLPSPLALGGIEGGREALGVRVSTAIGDVTLPLFALVSPDGSPLDIAGTPTVNAKQINAPFAPSVPSTTRHLGDPSTLVPEPVEGRQAQGTAEGHRSSLLYSTFIGGSNNELGYSVALTAAGEPLLTGYTQSADFPTSPGALDQSDNGSRDLFVLKLSADYGTLAYSTFIGGSNDDYGFSLAQTAAGEAVVTGRTESADFPTSGNAYDSSHNGSRDVFVLKLSADGGTLAYSTFIGGSDMDGGESLALTAAGEAFVTGYTESADFPTSGSSDSEYNGSRDLFVLKLSADGATLAYSTFIGGSDYDQGNSLGLTAAGEVFVTGDTESADFPTSANAYDSSHNGSRDLFLLKLSADGGTLAYSTFIGGSNSDTAESIALTAAGEAFLTGYTNSSNFPTSDSEYNGGQYDVFVLKLSADGTTLAYSTFIGGSDDERGYELALTAAGEALVAGRTESADFPTSANAYDSSYNENSDAFALKLSADGATVDYSTFIGGSSTDGSFSLALSAADEALVTGWTGSADFPTSANAYNSEHNGGSDLFLLRLDGVGVPTPTPTPTPTNTPTPSHTATPTATPTDEGDAYESDDSCEQARPISTDGMVQDHTFHTAGDLDWATFEVISGTEYLIEAQTPPDSTADVVLDLYDACDTLPDDTQNETFTPDIRLRFTAPQDGPLYLLLSNDDPDVGGPDKSFKLSVRALGDNPSPGAVVIVAGRIRANDPLQRDIYHVTNEVYRTFKSRGYDSERIFYLAPDTTLDADDDNEPDVDARATNQNLKQAITDWAVDKVGPNRAFTLYLMDHGGQDTFFLNGRSDTVTAEELDSWLDTLQETAPDDTKVNIFMEACHSGSFLDSVSGAERVVMASTGSYALAYASQLREGAVFSNAFLSALKRNMSLYGAFQEARWVVEEAHPDQTPWLDDDEDGIPNEGADGLQAQRRGFAYSGTLSDDQKWPPYIASAEIGSVEGQSGAIRADVRDDVSILSVTAIIYKPSYTPPDRDETEEIVNQELPTVALLDNDGIYSAIYEGFNEPGTYRIVLYAVDGEGIYGRPLAIETRLGGNQLYLPLVIR